MAAGETSPVPLQSSQSPAAAAVHPPLRRLPRLSVVFRESSRFAHHARRSSTFPCHPCCCSSWLAAWKSSASHLFPKGGSDDLPSTRLDDLSSLSHKSSRRFGRQSRLGEVQWQIIERQMRQTRAHITHTYADHLVERRQLASWDPGSTSSSRDSRHQSSCREVYLLFFRLQFNQAKVTDSNYGRT